MSPACLPPRFRWVRTITYWVALAVFAGLAVAPLPAQDEKFSIRVDLVWVTPAARTALTGLRSAEDAIGDANDLHAFRLNAGEQTKQAVLTGSRNDAIVPIASQTLIVASDQQASFVIGGRAQSPVVKAAALLEKPPPTGVDLLGPPLPQQPPTSPKRLERDFGLKVSLRPHKRTQGDFFIHMKAETNGVDFGQAKQRGERITPQLTFREFDQVLQVEPNQTFAVAGVLTLEDLAALRRAPGLDNSAVLSRVAQLRQDNPQGSVLVLVTPRLLAGQAQGGAAQ